MVVTDNYHTGIELLLGRFERHYLYIYLILVKTVGDTQNRERQREDKRMTTGRIYIHLLEKCERRC